MTQDTYRGEETDASTWNLYSYCGGNPVNYVDPSGHILISTCVLIGAATFGLIGAGLGAAHGKKVAKKAKIPQKEQWKYILGYGLGGAAIGAAIGTVIGYGFGVCIGATTESGVAVKTIMKGILELRKKPKHIMKKDHDWHLVLKKVDLNHASKVIKLTMKKGKIRLMDKKGNRLIYEAVHKYKKKEIEVHFSVEKKKVSISDAWVRNPQKAGRRINKKR